MLQQTLAIFLVLALLLAALWLLRRKGLATYNFASSGRLFGKDQDRKLRIVERLILTPQHSLHLVSLDDRLILLVTSPAGCQTVDSTFHAAGKVEPAINFTQGAATC